MSDGEIRRNFDRADKDRQAIAQRLADLAKDMVPAALWDAEHRAIVGQMARHEREAGEADARNDRQIQAFKDACDRATAEVRKELEKAVITLRAERNERSQFTWTRVIGILGIVTALVIALITTIAASKGIK
jgi:predicted ArsR family transcriptional regulator